MHALPFTSCYVRFRCLRDRVRHVLDVVVAVVFIKAPVLNTVKINKLTLLSVVNVPVRSRA